MRIKKKTTHADNIKKQPTRIMIFTTCADDKCRNPHGRYFRPRGRSTHADHKKSTYADHIVIVMNQPTRTIFVVRADVNPCQPMRITNINPCGPFYGQPTRIMHRSARTKIYVRADSFKVRRGWRSVRKSDLVMKWTVSLLQICNM